MSLAVSLQYLLPKRALTELAGWAASTQATWWVQRLIPWFIQRYGVNMAEAANPDPRSYPSFNAFFSRELKPGARPLAQADVVCPVDGAISQLGPIQKDQIFQAKGHHYSTQALVGGDAALAAQFDDGVFATIYLSPKDYHRIHMPAAARLRRMIHVPGELFSVNPATARGVPGLFARNERVVCVFDMPCGPHGELRPFVQVLVGAWRGQPAAPRPHPPMDLRRPTPAPATRRADGHLLARLHRRAALAQRHRAAQPPVGRRAGRAHGPSHGAVAAALMR